MKIKADKEAINLINQLTDIALKAGGLANLQGVQQVLASIEELKEEKKEEDAKDK